MKKDLFNRLPDEILSKIVSYAPKKFYVLAQRFRGACDAQRSLHPLGTVIRQAIEKHPFYISRKPGLLYSFCQYHAFYDRKNNIIVSKKPAIYPFKYKHKGGGDYLCYKIANYPHDRDSQKSKKPIIYINPNYVNLIISDKVIEIKSVDELNNIFKSVRSRNFSDKMWIWCQGFVFNKDFPVTDKFFKYAFFGMFAFWLPFEISHNLNEKSWLLPIICLPLLIPLMGLSWAVTSVCFVATALTPVVALLELTSKAFLSVVIVAFIGITKVFEKLANTVKKLFTTQNSTMKNSEESENIVCNKNTPLFIKNELQISPVYPSPIHFNSRSQKSAVIRREANNASDNEIRNDNKSVLKV